MWPGMPTSTTWPPGSVMAWAIDADEPTQSTATSAPPVGRPPTTNELVAERTERLSSLGAATQSAPSSVASRRWWAYFTVAMIVVTSA